jgi:uroporphyrinogen-III synthase
MVQLQEAGFNAQSLPLLELTDFLTPNQASKSLELVFQSHVVMFVSANAVRYLAKALSANPHWMAHFQRNARAWCTGPGTAAALQVCGIPASQIDQPATNMSQLDSEALWEVVSPQVFPGMRTLFVRGADESGNIAGRDWLVQQLEQRQVQVEAIAAYQRQVTHLDSEQIKRVSAFVKEGAIWLFSSSAALEGLVKQCPDLDWSKAKVVVTHPRIAQLAEKLGWHHISIAPPGIPSLLASIKSLA